MVKFSKQFEGQLVPEWKEAFVDYCKLKKDLKRIHAPPPPPLEKKKPSFLAEIFLTPLAKLPLINFNGRRDHAVIEVHRKLASSKSRGEQYETELLEQFVDTEAAKEFFARLDEQLNKVNKFYKGKEKEFVERWDSLDKQMEILIALKADLKQQQQKRGRGHLSSSFIKEDPSISYSVTSEDDSTRGGGGREDDDLATKCEQSEEQILSSTTQISDSENLEKKIKEETKPRSFLGGKVISFHGKNLKINIPLATPTRTISALTYLVWEDLLSQSRKCEGKININITKLHRAEKMIKGAFVELYKGLGYLKTYRNLNMLAFVKILKKFDKVTEKQALPIYLKVVESSYFNSSDLAIKLMEEVEELFIKHFAEENRRKAMKYLRPDHRKESHAITFFIGLFTGCFFALFLGYCLTAHVAGTYTRQSDSMYMETAYPVLSMFSLLFLHIFLYGLDMYFWRKTRINYPFIFELNPTKELKYREVFLISTTSMTLVLGVMFMHLALIQKGYPTKNLQRIPGLLIMIFFLVLLCPLDILFRSSRYRFLRTMRNILLSPLYKVVMVDFFMADQLCSQVPMLRNFEYVACYYISGSYKTEDYGYCTATSHYRDLAYAVSFLPYYWRAMQCARRWFDEGELSHLANLGKYVSAMLAAGAKVAYEKEKSFGCFVLVVVVSSAATIYQLYWDFVKDWGLLQTDSINPWLRNELVLRRKFIYFISMGFNFLLRLAWLQTVLHYNFGDLDYRVTSFFLAALEVIRRGHWNFYRLENEHLNNAGKFRAVKTVPLPFHEVDQD